MVLVLMNINVQYYEGVTKRGVLDLIRHVKKESNCEPCQNWNY